MSKIVYLLGAGASFGIRDKKKPTIEIRGVDDDMDILRTHVEYEYANIIEGLPLVSEITGRLSFWVDKLKEYKNHGKKTEHIYAGMSFDRALDKLIEDLTWLKTESSNHATIDTFAKKLLCKRINRSMVAALCLEPSQILYKFIQCSVKGHSCVYVLSLFTMVLILLELVNPK